MQRGIVPAMPSGRRLSELAAGVADGSAGSEELFEALLSATVFCERPTEPGFVAVGEPGEGMVPVFSSREELAAYVGRRQAGRQAGCDWFSTTGRDLLSLLPAGYDLAFDPASGHALRLRAAAWRRRPAVSVSSSSPPSEDSGGSR